MRVPLSWLRDLTPVGVEPTVLAATFDELGLVVDGIERVGEGLDGVVVAKVVAIEAIPKADKIRKVMVDAGGGDPVQVVCGAWNFEVGDVVPLAKVGAVLPGDFTIAERKMKGVTSQGMLCSGRELELSDDAGGILVLPVGLELGVPFAQAMGIERDVVFDLDITPNRPDAMGMVGVARDVAAKLGLPLHLPEPAVERGPALEPSPTVVVHDPDLSPRFAAQAITGVQIGPAPDWVARRLTLAGMRSINNAVDASNYVMLELGQPTHPYDLDRLPGRGLSVRAARPGERLVTLDGVERVLGQGAHPDCLICDAEGNPVGIAGVMGGASSEIGDDTTSVLLEAAYFTPMAVARTSKRLGLRTEASARFERGCDPEVIDLAVARFCQLLPGATVAGALIDERSLSSEPRRVRVRISRVNAVLGTDLSADRVRGYLDPIGFTTEPAAGTGNGIGDGPAPTRDELDVTLPSWRPDSEREIDVIEEVARHHGYDRIARRMPRPPSVGRLTDRQAARRHLRQVLVGAGLTEVWSPSLLAPGQHQRAGLIDNGLMIDNPLVAEESVLRTSMLPSMLAVVAANAARRATDLRLFDLANVFLPPKPGARLPDERERLAVALTGPAPGPADGGAAGAEAAVLVWREVEAALRVTGSSLEVATAPGLHPTRTARVTAGGAELGWVGEVDPAVLAAHGIGGRLGWIEIDLAALLDAPTSPHEARTVSRYPSADIDLAFAVAEDVPAAAVESALRQGAADLLESIELFDVYRGPGLPDSTRSLAFRLRLSALDHTLTDDELASARQRAIGAVTSSLPAVLRA